MSSLSFGFRDYAVHLFPGSLVISALLVLFEDFNWVTPALAPVLLVMFLFGGYVVGFVIETLTHFWIFKRFWWKYFSSDPLKTFFKDIDITENGYRTRDQAAKILCNDYSKDFVFKQPFAELLYLMMRDVEAANERSAAFVSRINALENMAKNMGVSMVVVAAILVVNGFVSEGQGLYSAGGVLTSVLLAGMMFKRRNGYRLWLAKSVVRAFVSLDRQNRRFPCSTH